MSQNQEGTQSPESRVPLPVQALLERLHLPADAPPPEEALQQVEVTGREVQGPRPLTETLEWELAALHWGQAGLLPFVENDVPYLVNNSGRLSQSAAAVFFAQCVETAPRGELVVLELGAGSGLFARYFLDALRELCKREGRDFYDRLRYHPTDRSPRTVAQWAERGLFAEHLARVRPGTCDALLPDRLRCGGKDGEEIVLSGVRAVFCNYLLDNLPATVLRRGPLGEVQEMCARTNLNQEPEVVRHYTPLSLSEIRALAASDDSAQRARLIPLLSLLEPEVVFLPVDPAAVPCGQEALAAAPKEGCVLVSYGAIRCLEACLELLAPDGMVLLNDYGPTRSEDVAGQTAPQRFGATLALGVNFALLGSHFSGAGRPIVVPAGDDRRMLHGRLLLPGPLPATAASFAAAFGEEVHRHVEGPLEEARGHLHAGRLSEALESYRTTVARCPRDFWMVGEAAEFAVSHLRDYQAGLELCRAAIALNPWYSGWLWNVLGDCLFCLNQVAEAHEAYLQAQRIDPGDVRTNLNLSFSFSQQGDYGEALLAIARGLARDTRGTYRARLLDKQQQIIAALSTWALGEQERLDRRSERLRFDRLGDPGAGTP